MALASAVRELADTDGAIGLQGGWGSGKSSVINFAEDILEPENKTDVRFSIFSFDLWSHQTDNFKRSLLEEIIQWAVGENIIKSNLAEKITDKIRDRKKIIVYDNKKSYNYLGSILILFLPLLPLIYTWLSPFAFGGSVFPDSTGKLGVDALGQLNNGANSVFDRLKWPHWVAIFGVSAIYLPFLIRLGKNLFDRQDFLKALSNAVSLFNRDVDKETITQNIRDEDPSSAEFQNLFREFLSTVQDDKHKLVVVIDNIDRLPLERALDVWAEARSIFALNPSNDKLKNSTVTVVIPYDEEYVAKSFAKNGGDNDLTSREDTRDLIQKTFNVVIRVSPPLAADWRAFFEKKASHVFSNLATDLDVYRLFKILDIHFQLRAVYPTPRHILSFINEISVLLSQWQGEVPIECIGLYVLHRDELEKHPEKLKAPKLVEERYLRAIHEPDWRKYLASLFFNVSVENANQVLLGQSIATALSSGDKDAFADLIRIRGFSEVLPDALELHGIDWAKEDAKTFSDVAECLAANDLSGPTARHIWSQMAEFSRYLRNEDLTNIKVVDYLGLFEVLRNQSGEESVLKVAHGLLHWISRCVPEVGNEGKGLTVSQGQIWALFVLEVWKAVSESTSKKTGAELMSSLRVPQGERFNLGVLGSVRGYPGFPKDNLKFSSDRNKMLSVLPDTIEENLECFCNVIINGEGILNSTSARTCLERCVSELNERVVESETNEIVQIIPYLHTYIDGDVFDAAMSTILDNGALAHQWSSAKSASNAQTAALLKWISAEVREEVGGLPENIETHPHFGDVGSSVKSFNQSFDDDEIDPDEVSFIREAVVRTGQFSRWQQFALTGTKWFVEIFKALVLGGQYGSIQVANYVENYDKTKNLLGDDLAKKYLEQFAGWNYLFDKHFSGENSLRLSPTGIIDIHRFSISGLSKLVDNVDKYFASISSEKWVGILCGGGKELDALCARLEGGGRLPPISSFVPAIFDYCKKILSGERKGTKQSKVSICALKLSPASRKKIARDLIVFMKEHNITTENVEGIVVEFPNVADEISFDEDPDTALDRFVLPLISSSDEDVFDFLKRRISDVERAFKKAQQDVQERVRETLEGIEAKAEENQSPLEKFYKENLEIN
ncbi:MAG: hypothetical protein GYB19_13150 [Rhodospirillales bacterium]|nr:hypothetical protein [Rhodospirillales bacterium]